MVFIKTSLEIQVGLDFFIRSGIAHLRRGMDKFKNNPFDPNNPYPKYNTKNEYFNDANNICLTSIWKLGLYDLCERYFAALHSEIRGFEKKNNVNFNKGMVYANLGVSQVAQGKIDEGFANLLKAHMEDAPYHKTDPTKSVFNLKLYSQFEDRLLSYVVGHAKLFGSQESVKIDEVFVKTILSALDSDSRLLFVSVIDRILRNLDILNDMDNRFTRGRLFSYMQDLCLFVEDAMKKGLVRSGKLRIQPGKMPTLKPLINKAFPTESWKTSIFDGKWKNLTRANNINDFESNLKNISSEPDFNVQRFLYLGAVRNFSSHNLDVSKNYFFQNFVNIFENILGTIFYMKKKNII